MEGSITGIITVPRDNNMDATRSLKIGRYKTFLKDCRDTDRKAEHCPVDVGRGGFVAHNVRRPLLFVGLTDCKANTHHAWSPQNLAEG